MKFLFLFSYVLFFSFSSFSQDSICTPTLKEIYDFEKGDVFIYLNQPNAFNYEEENEGYSFDTCTILSKQIDGDTIQYIRDWKGSSYYYRDTLFIVDSVNHALNTCDSAYFDVSSYLEKYTQLDGNHVYIKLYNMVNESNIPVKAIQGSIWESEQEYYEKDSMGHYVPYDDVCGYVHVNFANKTGQFEYADYCFEAGIRTCLYKKISEGDTTLFFLIGVSEIAKSKQVMVYPNPVNDVVHILSDEVIKEILVYDGLGNKVSVRMDLVNQSMDVSDLQPSLYNIRLFFDDGVVGVSRFIKR